MKSAQDEDLGFVYIKNYSFATLIPFLRLLFDIHRDIFRDFEKKV